MDYVRRGQLNRRDIARECMFSESVLRQNPAVKNALATLEKRLRDGGPLATAAEDKAVKGISRNAVEARSFEILASRLMQSKASADKRIKALEEENAALRAEIGMLRQQCRKYKHIEEHLEATGWTVRP